MFLGFIVEVLVMILFNLVVFSLLLRNVVFRPMISSNSKKKKNMKEIWSRLKQFIFFWFLLGMSWVLGFLTLIPDRGSFVPEILFCIFTSLQGLTLFIFICLKNPEVGKALQKTSTNMSDWSTERGRSKRKMNSTNGSTSTERVTSSC